MSAFKLFISHSSKTDENRAFLGQITSNLDQLDGGQKCDVLVDKRIAPNTEWFPEINEWMMECQAAVILLSEKALESEWVKAEAAVLCARRRSEGEKFKLILVPLDQVDPDKLNKHPFFKVIRIADFQIIRDCNDHNEIIQKVCQIVSEIQTPIPFDNTPFGKMATLIQEILDEIDQNVLARALNSLDIINADNITHSYTDALSRFLLRNPNIIYTILQDLIEELANVISKQQAFRLLEIIKGHWVNPEAGASFQLMEKTNQAVAINCIEIADFTGDCYSRKAWPFPQDYTLINAGTDRNLEAIKDTLLSSELANSAISQSRKESRIKRYKEPLLLVFPYPDVDHNIHPDHIPFPDAKLISDIKTEYQNITVVMATGPELPASLNHVQTLMPLLEDSQENDQCSQYEDVIYYLNKLN